MKKKEAIIAGLTRYNTGRPCLRGHTSDRAVSGGKCLACHSILETSRNKNAGQVYKNRMRTYYEANADLLRARSRAWAKDNPQRRKAAEFKRRCLKSQALPLWLTRDQRNQITNIYLTCPDGYQVDHAIPLNSPIVCGLHVPWNLQHLTAEANSSKSNKVLDEFSLPKTQEFAELGPLYWPARSSP